MLDTNAPIFCDGCGTRKRETNHWFLAFPSTGQFNAADEQIAVTTLCLMPWHDVVAALACVRHLCGQQCANKALDHYLQHGNLDSLKPPRLV